MCIIAHSTEFWLYFILVAAGGPRYESIDEKPEVWAEKCMEYMGNGRTGLSPEQKRRMEKFDSRLVAKEMEEFYLEESQRGDKR